MEEFKGTKGEWRVDVNVGHQDFKNRSIRQKNGGITVAVINRFSPYEIPVEVQEANANLIAAAPELLETLTKLHQAISSGNPHELSEWNLKAKTLTHEILNS